MGNCKLRSAPGAMNIFRFLGDLSHIVSFLVLLHKIIKGKSSAGISLRTQELYAVVFCSRYIDLLWNFSSMYNWILKVVFISASVAIVYRYMTEDDYVQRIVWIAGV